jgi:hypothetical protein
MIVRGWEHNVQKYVAERIYYEKVKREVNRELDKTRIRWETRSEYSCQRRKDLPAFQSFTMAVYRSASKKNGGGLEYLGLLMGTKHIRTLIGTFLLVGGREFWKHIKVCTKERFLTWTPFETVTVAPNPNQFEYALRRLCFNILEIMRLKDRTYKGCLSEDLLKELIVRRDRDYTPFSPSEKRNHRAYCDFQTQLTDSEEDKFWEDAEAAYKKRVGNSQ